MCCFPSLLVSMSSEESGLLTISWHFKAGREGSIERDLGRECVQQPDARPFLQVFGSNIHERNNEREQEQAAAQDGAPDMPCG